MRKNVLDHGFVELIDSMGSDLTVVNSARVSFGKRKKILSEEDIKLIHYLAKHKHWSPFRHVQLQFHCKVPEFIARQWYKHIVGISYTDSQTVDHAWNEISMRYVDSGAFDFYTPEYFRKQSSDNRQASSDEVVDDPEGILRHVYETQQDKAIRLYKKMLEMGVAKEQARAVFPLSFYTEFYWTASLQAIINFIRLRKHRGAQYEIRQYAEVIGTFTEKIVPISQKALLS